ncbi:BlaI/MecI/CopY family transcriptional regulator [Verrucomicrobiales bacterium]|nr:BlaI/MecI/CopY family transcriptional regulator [Verrucomicrobiales bacterium]
MPKKKANLEDPALSRREREVMEVLFRNENATARDVWSALGEARTYSTVRKQLSILEEKGHVTHRVEGGTFLYSPRVEREVAATSAMTRLVDTFFQGSVAGAVSSLLGDPGGNISAEELERISGLIEEARKNREGKQS